MGIVSELRIAVLQSQISNMEEQLYNLCHSRGNLYAKLEVVEEPTMFTVVGWRVNKDEVNDPTINYKAETVAYIDKMSGNVYFIDEDAPSDEACRKEIDHLLEQLNIAKEQ